MSISNYLKKDIYSLHDFDKKYIHLYSFNNPILNYITDEDMDNGIASVLTNTVGYRLYVDDISLSVNATINSRFQFESKLTVTLVEKEGESNNQLINEIIGKNWMILFSDVMGGNYILNGEYPAMVTYSMSLSDNGMNVMVIDFTSLSNTPILNYDGIINYSYTLRDYNCSYNTSKVISLNMATSDRISIDFDDSSIVGSFSEIEFNESSFSYTMEFDGKTYNNTLQFSIPLSKYNYSWHYDLLNYNNNRYYALLKTSNGNEIFIGYPNGLFPTYEVTNNEIIIKLNGISTFNSLIDSQMFEIIETEGCEPSTSSTLSNVTFNVNPTIVEYNQYPNVSVSYVETIETVNSLCVETTITKNVSIDNVPILSTNPSGENINAYDRVVTATTEFGIFTFTQEGNPNVDSDDSGSGSTESTLYRWYYNGDTYCLDESQQFNCLSSSTATFDSSDENTFVVEDGKAYERVNIYISTLCDGNYELVGFEKGNEITSSERIYRWAIDENIYRCDTTTFTKYAIEVEQYSDTNGAIWINTENTRDTDVVIEDFSEDCGYGDNKNLIGEDGSIPLNISASGKMNITEYDEYPSDDTLYFIDYYNTCGDSVRTTSSTINYNVNASEMRIFTIENDYAKIKNIPCSYLNEIDMTEAAPTYNNTEITYKGIPYFATVIKDPFGDHTAVSSFKVPNFFGINAQDVYFSTIYEFTKGSNSATRYEITNEYSTDLDLSHWDLRHCKTFELGFDVDTKLNHINFSDLNMQNIQDFTLWGGEGDEVGVQDYLFDFDLSSLNVTNLTNLDIDGWRLKSVNLSNWKLNNKLDKNLNICYSYLGSSNITYRLPIDEIILNDVSYYTYKTLMDDTTVLANTWTTNINLNPIGEISFTRSTSGDCTINLNDESYTISSTNGNYSVQLSDILDEPLYLISESGKTPFISSDVVSITKFPDTSQIVDMSGMFSGCTNLTSLDLSSFDTSNVLHMDNMFSRCSSLTDLNLSNWNVSNVKSMNNMFYDCESLRTLNLSNWIVSEVNNFYGMFNYCNNLQQVIISDYRLELILKLYFGNSIEIIKTNDYYDSYDGFIDMTTETIKLEKISDVTCPIEIRFEQANGYFREHISTLSCEKNTDIRLVSVYNCDNIFSLPLTVENSEILSGVTGVINYSKTNYIDDNLISTKGMILNEGMNDYITTLAYAFRYTSYLDCNGFTAQNVIDTTCMCYQSPLKEIDLSGWDLSNVTKYQSMFSGCDLTKIYVYNCNETTIQFIQDRLLVDGFTSSYSNGIITVNQ